MKKNQGIAALFDLDGVIVDTERQYGCFWERMGKELNVAVPDFHQRIKGNTLNQIFQLYFPGQDQTQKLIREKLAVFECQMTFSFIPGAESFIRTLREQDVRMAIVTSSDGDKMNRLYEAHPDIRGLFDTIVTADRITRSKPDPECYLQAASLVGTPPERCFVFEDSFAGLAAGRAAGMYVIGLATTYPAEQIADCADRVISDFRTIQYSDLISTQNG